MDRAVPTTDPTAELTSNHDVIAALTNSDLVPDVSTSEEFVGHNPDVTFFQALRGTEHACRRARVSRVLGAQAVRRWEPWLRDEALRQACAFDAGGQIEVGDQFARPLCADGVAYILSLPRSEVRALISPARQVMDATRTERRRQLAGYRAFLVAKESLERSRRGELTSGLISTLVKAEVDPSDILGIVMPLLVGGIELTARALLATLVRALANPRGVDCSDASIDAAIGESGIIPGVPRVVTRDTSVGDTDLQNGDRIALMLHADTASSARPLPFGLGAHFCMGAPWTRAVARSGAMALLEVFPMTRVQSVTTAIGAPGGPVTVNVGLRC
jgi:cytochrome P450